MTSNAPLGPAASHAGLHGSEQAEHRHDVRPFAKVHSFQDAGAAQRATALTWVTIITLITMVAELVAGYWSGSLALTADGWHMGTHAVALGGAALAYRLSRRAAGHEAYAFGGWKIEVLSGYTSGLMLMAVSVWLVFDSVRALFRPEPVDYAQALMVAGLGLVVNIVSAWLLSRGGDDGHGHGHGHSHGHSHAPSKKSLASAASQADSHMHDHAATHAARAHGADEGHGHGHGYGHDHRHHTDDDAHGQAHQHHSHASPKAKPAKAHDHNFNAAYVHVLADMFTSVLAVVALCGGLWFGWRFLDPLVALLGAAIIGQWAVGVLRDSATALVDASTDPELARRMRSLIESDGDAQVTDLHVWQVGTSSYAAMVSIVADKPLPPADYQAKLESAPELRHVTVEVHRCSGAV